MLDALLKLRVYPALTPSDTTWALQPIDDTIGKTFRADVEAELETTVLMGYNWEEHEKGTMSIFEKRIATSKAVQHIFDRWGQDHRRLEQIKAAALRTGLAITPATLDKVVPNRCRASSSFYLNFADSLPIMARLSTTVTL